MFRTTLILLLLAATSWADLEAELDDAARAGAPRIRGQLGVHSLFYGETPDDFALSVGGWWARLTGPITLGSTQLADVSETFGLSARKFIPTAQAAIRFGFIEIGFEGFWYENSGRAVVDEEFEIDGVVFEVGDTIDSTLKFHAYTLTLGFTVWRRDEVTVSLFLGFTALYTEGKVKAVSADKVARWSEILPLPMIGASARGYIVYPWVYEVAIGWIGINLDAFGARALQTKIGIGYEINDWVAARVGYRYLGIRANVEDAAIDLQLDGFYFEISFLF